MRRQASRAAAYGRVPVPQAGSQRQPSLSAQVMVSPSPAKPVTPWSDARQNSPGS